MTSSIRPIFNPERDNARSALCPPGPGDFVLLPPVARILMCNAVMPSSLHRAATSCAASIAAYGEDSSRSAFTFIPPVHRLRVSLPDKSVTCCVVERARRSVSRNRRSARRTARAKTKTNALARRVDVRHRRAARASSSPSRDDRTRAFTAPSPSSSRVPRARRVASLVRARTTKVSLNDA